MDSMAPWEMPSGYRIWTRKECGKLIKDSQLSDRTGLVVEGLMVIYTFS